jgi:hypothetical protein
MRIYEHIIAKTNLRWGGECSSIYLHALDLIDLPPCSGKTIVHLFTIKLKSLHVELQIPKGAFSIAVVDYLGQTRRGLVDVGVRRRRLLAFVQRWRTARLEGTVLFSRRSRLCRTSLLFRFNHCLLTLAIKVARTMDSCR